MKQNNCVSIATAETGAHELGQFREEVVIGLSSKPKRLSSKYFYDKKGDQLFQQIMRCSEYYLTRCELDIFQHQTDQLASLITDGQSAPFDLIELGAGDGTKTRYLLSELINREAYFTYMPIDISGNILSELEQNLSDLNGLNIHPLEGEYLDMLYEAATISANRKVVLFLGSNIGNMDMVEARRFCLNVRNMLQPGDLFLIGFDLKKNPQTILSAYNDKDGITRDFNLNLLQRINNELDADFDLSQFIHYPTYDPHSGACKSYLVSTSQQTVRIGDAVISFAEGEWIFTEISQKYSLPEIRTLAAHSGFAVVENLTDKKRWFVDSVWTALPSRKISPGVQ